MPKLKTQTVQLDAIKVPSQVKSISFCQKQKIFVIVVTSLGVFITMLGFNFCMYFEINLITKCGINVFVKLSDG